MSVDDAEGSSPVERFLAHLDALTGIEPAFSPSDAGDGLPAVITATYAAVPEDGYMTAFTYGVSLAEHEVWTAGRPELTLTVRSHSAVWGDALGAMAANLRRTCAFRYGDVVDFGSPLAPDTQMTRLLCFAPAILAREDSSVDVGRDRPVNLVGCYPVHDREADFIDAHGLPAFWDLDWDPYDVGRPAAC